MKEKLPWTMGGFKYLDSKRLAKGLELLSIDTDMY